MVNVNPLVATAIEELPELISFFKYLFAKKNPNQPSPTSDEVLEALDHAVASGIAKDDLWLATHPIQS